MVQTYLVRAQLDLDLGFQDEDWQSEIPLMLFERKQDAQKFADELGARLTIHKEHITVKARKFTR